MFVNFNLSTTIITILIALLAVIIIVAIVRKMAKGKSASSSSGSRSTHTAGGANEQIYVGNLPYRVNEYDLKDYFAQYGNIQEARVVKNRKTGRSKGYGFVTFSNAKEAEKSLAAHGVDMNGRTMVVRIAKARE